MKYGVALGEIGTEGKSLLEQVDLFIGAGFTVLSFCPKQLFQLTDANRDQVFCRITEGNAATTLHTQFATPVAQLIDLARLMSPHLASITFDPILRWTTAGLLFDTNAMCSYLRQLDDGTPASDFCYGIEDFPEDAFAVGKYKHALAPFLDSSRFGVLIDVGHTNISRHKYGYLQVSPEEHFCGLPAPLLEVHLSDNDGKEDLHLPLGEGTIDFRSICQGLKGAKFNGIATIEIVPSQHGGDGTKVVSQSIESLHFWKNLYETLPHNSIQATPNGVPDG